MGFSINYEGPSSVGNSGPVTLKLTGGQLREDMTYEIVDCNGGVHAATSVYFVNSSLVYATFDLTGLPACSYSVRVRFQGNTAVSGTPVTVSPGSLGQIEISLLPPKILRAGGAGKLEIRYKNVGNTNAIAPLMELRLEGGLIGKDPTAVNRDRVYLLGINQEGPAGVLPPGAGGTITLDVVQSGTGFATISYSINTAGSPNDPIIWSLLKDGMKPAYIPADAWEAVFSNFTATVGNTTYSYNVALAEAATTLGRLGEYTYDVNRFLVFLLARSGLMEITARYSLGSFGRGRSHPWEISGQLESGKVMIHYPGGRVRGFYCNVSDPAIPCVGGPGDYGVLTRNLTGNDCLLTEPDGTRLHFLQDPADMNRLVLEYSEDLNGNRIILNYTGAQVTSVTDTKGDTIGYTYNPQGRISQMVDPVGRVTTYTYDASGEHLMRFTDLKGTTSFSYVTGQGAAREHALQSITYPDGTHSTYEYDSRGRLSRRYRDGGAESVSFTYDSLGGVAATDAAGNVTRFLYYESGHLGQLIDPLGATTSFDYDQARNLISTNGPQGFAYSYGYDSRGNRTQVIDPQGYVISMAYGANARLTALTDTRGNRTQYEHDSNFNLSGITYPNGSREQFSYDARGNLTRKVNRRGQAISFTYDTHNLLRRKTYRDGSQVDYTYDGHRNRITATDSTGTTNFTYDTADRLTQIDFPNGRFLHFTYDIGGRRTQLEDPSGVAVNYTYDPAGRLAGLSDGSGQPLVNYIYDAVGRPARKNMGNGTYTTYDYDGAGRLLHLINYAPGGSILSRFDYTYDALGRRTSMTTLDGLWTYQNDVSGQLTSITLPGGRTIQYVYDAAGNRVSVTDNGLTTNYTSNGHGSVLECRSNGLHL